MFENSCPILRVTNLEASLEYYVSKLGFSLDWTVEGYASVGRDSAHVMLCEGAQGHPGTWVWFGVNDAQILYQEYVARGVRFRHEPRNFPWALEFKVIDPDDHVLRFGSGCLEGVPFASSDE